MMLTNEEAFDFGGAPGRGELFDLLASVRFRVAGDFSTGSPFNGERVVRGDVARRWSALCSRAARGDSRRRCCFETCWRGGVRRRWVSAPVRGHGSPAARGFGFG
jgi:hypothetical protein